MRPRAPSEPEIPDLAPVQRDSTPPRATAAAVEDVFEGELDRSSLPPEPGGLAGDWAEFSSPGGPRSASTPPRSSGFVRVPAARASGGPAVPSERPSLLTEPAAVRPTPGYVRAVGPGLVMMGASVLLTLVDQRTSMAQGSTALLESRPPTWIAGVVCVVGLCWVAHGLWHLTDER